MLRVPPEQLWHIVSHSVWILCEFILWASLLAHKAREQRVANVCPVSRDTPRLCASYSTLCMKFQYLMSCKLQCCLWERIPNGIRFTDLSLDYQVSALLVGFLSSSWEDCSVVWDYSKCDYCYRLRWNKPDLTVRQNTNSLPLTERYKVPINCLASFLFVFFFALIMSLGTILLSSYIITEWITARV